MDQHQQDQPPARLPKMEDFDVVRPLASGSFGQIFLVRNAERQLSVLKKISVATLDEKERQSVEQEVALLAAVRHPNIVAYKDNFVDQNHLCILMEYCDSGDLYTYLQKRKNQPMQTAAEEVTILEWLIQIVTAVQFLHARSILHRDLKSQNIFLHTGPGPPAQSSSTSSAHNSRADHGTSASTRLIKLGDFGIAKVLDSTVDLAKTQIGTPFYMSPEVFKNASYSYKSDIWGIGCVLYELVSGKHAFGAQSLNGLAVKVLRGRYTPLPPSLKCSKEVQSLIKSLLSVNPQHRPSISEMLHLPILRKRIRGTIKQVTAAASSAQEKAQCHAIYSDQLCALGLGILVDRPKNENMSKAVKENIEKDASNIRAKLELLREERARQEATLKQLEETMKLQSTAGFLGGRPLPDGSEDEVLSSDEELEDEVDSEEEELELLAPAALAPPQFRTDRERVLWERQLGKENARLRYESEARYIQAANAYEAEQAKLRAASDKWGHSVPASTTTLDEMTYNNHLDGVVPPGVVYPGGAAQHHHQMPPYEENNQLSQHGYGVENPPAQPQHQAAQPQQEIQEALQEPNHHYSRDHKTMQQSPQRGMQGSPQRALGAQPNSGPSDQQPQQLAPLPLVRNKPTSEEQALVGEFAHISDENLRNPFGSCRPRVLNSPPATTSLVGPLGLPGAPLSPPLSPQLSPNNQMQEMLMQQQSPVIGAVGAAQNQMLVNNRSGGGQEELQDPSDEGTYAYPNLQVDQSLPPNGLLDDTTRTARLALDGTTRSNATTGKQSRAATARRRRQEINSIHSQIEACMSAINKSQMTIDTLQFRLQDMQPAANSGGSSTTTGQGQAGPPSGGAPPSGGTSGSAGAGAGGNHHARVGPQALVVPSSTTPGAPAPGAPSSVASSSCPSSNSTLSSSMTKSSAAPVLPPAGPPAPGQGPPVPASYSTRPPQLGGAPGSSGGKNMAPSTSLNSNASSGTGSKIRTPVVVSPSVRHVSHGGYHSNMRKDLKGIANARTELVRTCQRDLGEHRFDELFQAFQKGSFLAKANAKDRRFASLFERIRHLDAQATQLGGGDV
ncbi:unnamed protein product [Amoebophrya sp. A25]|nr:unnamed protein product [Amoebophrya sp. A25]|eukprot:GSA25T00012895001.1